MTGAKPLGVADYLVSPERAVALLNKVIASGGDLTAVKQAVAIVAGALARAGWGADGGAAQPMETRRGKGEAHMTAAKPEATHVPAFIDPPPVPPPGMDDPALLGEWIAFRDDMDELEASLSIDHPELDWTDAMRPFKDEADTAIRTLTIANKLPRRED